MRIGFVVEGSNEDAGDVHAVRVLCRRVAEANGLKRECIVVAGKSKVDVLTDAADHVAALRGAGCQRVVIVWDNCPPWRGNLDDESFLCAVGAWRVIKKAGHSTANVVMVCSKRELEAWLLTDDAAISTVLGQVGRGALPSISGSNQPDTIAKPKDRLQDWWYQRCRRAPTGPEYGEICDLVRLQKLRRSPSFKRFEAAIC